MYLRFVVSELDEDSNKKLGVFHAIGRLRATGKLYSYEEIHHDLIRQWFNENLKKRTRFTAWGYVVYEDDYQIAAESFKGECL